MPTFVVKLINNLLKITIYSIIKPNNYCIKLFFVNYYCGKINKLVIIHIIMVVKS